LTLGKRKGYSAINDLILRMGILTQEIKEFVKQTKLGFVATVCPDGTPNLSPKGTTTVWDDDHLVFADIHSPGTVTNLLLIHLLKSI
jgi:predicted pyridoxine 5'-phosphate oxidase superfamily flavin-nucleotide-binding protein